MPTRSIVKDIMLEIFEYPHIPYWFSIEQAIKVMKASFFQTQKLTEPIAILVFDEKYNLLGTVTLKDILKGLEPSAKEFTSGKETELDMAWNNVFTQESKKLVQKPISEIMVSAKHYVAPDDPLTKAAFLMINFDLPLLPVIEDKKKFVGIVRMIEVFDAISEKILKE